MTASSIPDLKYRLAEKTGLERSLFDCPALKAFVERRCRELALPDEQSYHELIIHDHDELERLIQQVSVCETWFFRYPASFALLVDQLTKLRRLRSADLRMLSVACATGEEPYSMAMAAAEAGWPLDRIAVDAVDRHEESLAIARKAVYGRRSLREPIPEWAQSWIRQTEADAQVDARITATVNFARADIVSSTDPAMSHAYDVVFCRNLFIYLGSPAREALAAKLTDLLSPQGLLFVGHAEQLDVLKDRFEAIPAPHAFAFRPRQTSRDESLNTPQVDSARSRSPVPTETIRARRSPPPRKAPEKGVRTASAVPELHRAEPPTPITTIAAAQTHADHGRLDDALSAIEAILEQDRPAAATYALLGSVKLGLGRLTDARDAFKKVLYLEPDHEEALLQLAIIHERMGDTDSASRYRRRAARAHQEQSQS